MNDITIWTSINIKGSECAVCGVISTSSKRLNGGRDCKIASVFAKFSRLDIDLLDGHICRNCERRLHGLEHKCNEFAKMCHTTLLAKHAVGPSKPDSLLNPTALVEHFTGLTPAWNEPRAGNQILKVDTVKDSGLRYDKKLRSWRLNPFVQNLSTSLYILYKEKTLSDVVLKCRDAEGDTFYIPAHSCVLAASSSILQDVLMKGPKNSTIELKGFSKPTIVNCLDFMYGQVIYVDLKGVKELHFLAKELKLTQLTFLLDQIDSVVASDHNYTTVTGVKQELARLDKELPLVLAPPHPVSDEPPTIDTEEPSSPISVGSNGDIELPETSAAFSDKAPKRQAIWVRKDHAIHSKKSKSDVVNNNCSEDSIVLDESKPNLSQKNTGSTSSISTISLQTTSDPKKDTRPIFRKIMPKPTGNPDLDLYLRKIGEQVLTGNKLAIIPSVTGNNVGLNSKEVGMPGIESQVPKGGEKEQLACYFFRIEQPKSQANTDDSDHSYLKCDNNFAQHRVVCVKCLDNFDSVVRYKEHSLICEVERSNRICRKCEIEFKTLDYYGKHLSRHLIWRSVKCPFCLNRINDAHDYTVHLGRLCLNGTVKLERCDHCNRYFKNKAALLNHKKDVAANPESLLLKGIITGGQPKNKEFYKRRYQAYKNRKYTCPTCKKVITSYDRYRVHRFTHTDPYVCHVCGNKFQSPDVLKIHVRRSHESTKCSKCDFQADSRPSLALHLVNEHQGESSVLKMHVRRSHESTKCSKCDFQADSRPSLALHLVNEHQGDSALHVCSKCGSVFPSEAGMKRHEAFHDRIQYNCRFCGFKTWGKERYDRHMKLNHQATEDKILTCNICSKTLKRMEDIVKHLKRKHQIELPTVENTERQISESILPIAGGGSSQDLKQEIVEDTKGNLNDVENETEQFAISTGSEQKIHINFHFKPLTDSRL